MTAPSDPDANAPVDTPPARRRSGLRTIAVAIVLVAALLVGAGLWASRDTGQPAVAGSGTDAPRLGEAAPADEAFALPPATLDGFAGGEAVELASFRGKPLIVNFWATWCAPCVREMPDFQEAYEKFGDRVQFLGVDVADSPPNAEPFVARLGVDYPLALDPNWELHRGIGNVGMPTTLLVDAEGIVRYRYTGPLDLAELEALLRKHLDIRV